MNIFIINFGLYKGGTEIQLFRTISKIKEIKSSKYRFVIACLKNDSTFDRSFENLNVRVYKNLMRFKGDPLALIRLLSVIREENPELIYVLNCEGYILPFSILAGGILKLPVIAQYTVTKPKLIPFYNKPFVRFLHQIIAISEVQRKYIINLGVKREKVNLIYNGIDVCEFDPAKFSENRNYLKNPYIKKHTFLIGIVASLSLYKNHELLFRAASILVSKIQNVHFLVVGDGPMERELKDLVHSLKLDKAVSFLGRRIDIKEIIKQLDILIVSSSSTEACPNVVLEAMALAKPVVSTPIGGIPELVIHGKTGFLVPLEDEEKMADSIIKLIKDNDLLHSMGRCARQRAIKFFTIETKIEKLERLFKKSINRLC